MALYTHLNKTARNLIKDMQFDIILYFIVKYLPYVSNMHESSRLEILKEIVNQGPLILK